MARLGRSSRGSEPTDAFRAAGWFAVGKAHSVSKAGLWMATNAFRLRFAADGVQVLGVYPGPTDTPMQPGPDRSGMNDPSEVARAIFASVDAGDNELLVDEMTKKVHGGCPPHRPPDTVGVVSAWKRAVVKCWCSSTKNSGVGRELGRSGMDRFANIKTYGLARGPDVVTLALDGRTRPLKTPERERARGAGPGPAGVRTERRRLRAGLGR